MNGDAGMRGRSPGRSPMRRSASGRIRTLSSEPPRDLRELRRECPNIRWGGNVPSREPEPQETPAPQQADRAPAPPGLPEAYLMATRGGYGTATQGNSTSYSNIRSSSRGRTPTTPRAARLSALAPRSPWKGSGMSNPSHSGHSGVFSAPRSAESGTHVRPGSVRTSKSPSASSRIYSAPQPSPRRRAFTSGTRGGSRTAMPGFGEFLTTAAPVGRSGERSSRVPKADRSPYSKSARRRTPSPRPGVSERRKRKAGEKKASAPTSHQTDKLMHALAGRADLERELQETCVDPTQQIAPDLDEYLQEVHHPVNYGATSYLADQTEEVEPSQQASQTSEQNRDYFPPVKGEYLPYSNAVEKDVVDEDEMANTVPIPGDGPLVLEDGGYPMEEEEGTPLHWAAKRGQLELLEALIAKGADVRVTLFNGKTALDVACDTLEERALSGDDVEEIRQVIHVLECASATAKEAPKKDNAKEQEEELGAGIYRQILRVLPRQSWECITDYLPQEELHKAAKCCKGMQALTRPRLLRLGATSFSGAHSDTEDLAIAMFNLQTFGQRRLADAVAADQPPTMGVLRVLQALCILLGNRWIELRDVWSVTRYLLSTDNPMAQLSELARDPESLTWEQATWVISIFAEHANDMAVASDELMGAVLTVIVSLLTCHANKVAQLPPLRLPEGYLPPARRPKDALNAVTTLRTI